MTAHALFSPSSMALITKCPFALSIKTPNEFSQAASEGTARHAEMEEIVKKHEMFGLNTASDDFLVSKTATFLLFLLDGMDENRVVLSEVKVHFNDLLNVEPDKAFGTADLVIYEPISKRLSILDYKFGRVPVSATNNVQLSIYAYGALFYLMENKIINTVIDVQEIVLGILQPQAEQLYNSFNTTPASLFGFLQNIIKPVDFVKYLETNNAKELKKCAGEHCTSLFCKGKERCRAYHDWCISAFDML